MRTRTSSIAVLAVLSLLLVALTRVVADPPAAKPADGAGSAKEVVTTFYRNLAAGKAKSNESLFTGPEAPVGGVSQFPNRTQSWQKKPAEFLRQHGDRPKYLEVDAADVDLVHPGLAVAKVKYRGGGIKGYAVLTLSEEGGQWRIAQLYEKTYFVW